MTPPTPVCIHKSDVQIVIRNCYNAQEGNLPIARVLQCTVYNKVFYQTVAARAISMQCELDLHFLEVVERSTMSKFITTKRQNLSPLSTAYSTCQNENLQQ